MKYYFRLILVSGVGLFFLFSPAQAQAPDLTPTPAGFSVIPEPSASVILNTPSVILNRVKDLLDSSPQPDGVQNDIKNGTGVQKNDLVPKPSRRVAQVLPRGTEGLPLNLVFPLQGPSIHTNYTGTADTFTWTDINSNNATTYGVVNDQFVYQPDDTWFVYGLFGPIEAVNYDYNVKYLEWGGRHNGIDLATAIGTPVISASGGEVVFTGTKAGNTIVVQTDTFQITYSHLSKISVTVGERVTQGQTIGLTGNSSTINPHLHFQIDQIIRSKRWGINPAKYLLLGLQTAVMPDVPANQYTGSKSSINLADDFRW